MIKLYDNLGFNSREVDVKFWTFPAGERGVKIDSIYEFQEAYIDLTYKSSDDLIDLALLIDAIREIGARSISLQIQYFPYARQDRKCNYGESHSLRVICNFINSLGFDRIYVADPHSTVLEALLPAGVLDILPQHIALSSAVNLSDNYVLCSPDAGALKKIYSASGIANNKVIEAGKVRDVSTGEIVSSCILQGPPADEIQGHKILVVDDICDGGRTFIELAKVLNAEYPGIELELYVTHGIFSKGKEILYEYFSKIHCYNDLSVVE